MRPVVWTRRLAFLAVTALSGCVGWTIHIDRTDTHTVAPITSNDTSPTKAKPVVNKRSEAPRPKNHEAWFAGNHWLPNANYDAARDVLPLGFRGSESNDPDIAFAWRFRSPTRPDVINVAALREAARYSGTPGDHATILLARVAPSTALVERLQEIAVAGRTSFDPKQPEAPYRSQSSTATKTPASDFATNTRRAAAIEAWGHVLATSAAGEEAWASLARIVSPSETPSVPVPDEVQAEVFRAVGRAIAPTRLETVADWLETDHLELWPAESRRAVLDGAVLFAQAVPDARRTLATDMLVRLRYDRDAAVRLRYGRLVALLKLPDGHELLDAQTRDIDPRVQAAAYESLGLLGTTAAIERLQEAADNPSDPMRAAVVAGLAAARQDVAFAVRDDSAVVRQAVAKAFADTPTAVTSQHLARLAVDADRQVQTAAVRSVLSWPDELALSVLTKATTEASIHVRRDALRQLRHRTGIKDSFLVEASRAERVARMAEWKQRYQLPGRVMIPSTRSESTHDLGWALLQLDADARSPAAWRALERLTAADIPALERWIGERTSNGRPSNWPKLWNDVLPNVRGDFAALSRLRSKDPLTRQRGSAELAQFSTSQTPSSLVLDRLPAILTTEQNAVIWRNVMRTIAYDVTPSGDKIIPLALHSPWPDVRVMACEFVEKQARPEHAAWLRPLLNDSDITVRQAATRAAGACGHPALLDGPEGGLRSLLAAPTRDERMEAALAMARLGDTAGVQELLRLAHSDDVNTRRRVAGQLPLAADASMIDSVLSLAWTERDTQTRQSYLDLLEQLQPGAASWPEDATDTRKLELFSAALRPTQ